MSERLTTLSRVKLSVLVPTVPRRVGNSFRTIIKKLERQDELYGNGQVEILGLYDNKRMKLGDKRNRLLEIASGEYVAFVDDDDEVDDTYINSILGAIMDNQGVDVIHYPIICTMDNGRPKYCEYGLHLDYFDSPDYWTGKPTHTHIWNQSIARQARFPVDKTFGEDLDWVDQVCAYASTEFRIDKVLYYYKFDSTKTETRG